MAKPQFGFRIEPGLKEAIEKEAKAEDRSPSWMANYLLKKGLEARQLEKKKKRAA